MKEALSIIILCFLVFLMGRARGITYRKEICRANFAFEDRHVVDGQHMLGYLLCDADRIEEAK